VILDDRHDMITQSLSRQIKDSKHPLHYLLPPIKVSHSETVLQPTYPYQIPLAKTSRYGRDFVPYCIAKKFSFCCISLCLGLIYIRVFDCYVKLFRFVLLVLLLNFVMYCIVSTVVVAFEINIYLSVLEFTLIHNTLCSVCSVQLPELASANVRMKDPDRVSRIIRSMITNGSQRLQVIPVMLFHHTSLCLVPQQ